MRTRIKDSPETRKRLSNIVARMRSRTIAFGEDKAYEEAILAAEKIGNLLLRRR
jgi:hypothetical protein